VTEQIFFQTFVNAILLSLIYMLMAIGLTLVFSIMSLINFAHGTLYMMGGFAVYLFFERLRVNYWLGIIIGIVFVGLFGGLLERGIFRRLRKDMLQACLASLGVAMILETGALIIFGELDKDVSTVFKGVIEFSGVFVPWEKMVIVLVSAAVAGALIVFIKYSRAGQALQAVAQDADAAAFQGINVSRMNSLGFAIGCGLAAAAGGLISPLFFVSSYMGNIPLMKAFMVIIMGGLGSIPGAVLASFILGFVEQFSLTLVGYIGNVFGFIIIMLFLLFRPRGLLGREFKLH
jgi:branched-chain amino acid transport system permease protein